MSKINIGDTVGIFTIIEKMNCKDKDGHALYKGACNECGFERMARLYDLQRTTECTHIRIDGEVAFNRTNWCNKRIGSIFEGIKKRCYEPFTKSYRWYGGKGVKVCDEWMSNPKLFEEWSLQNGYNDLLTIDRINANGNYCPENCRWVTKEFNSKYTSRTSLINVNGEVHSGKDWARKLGFEKNLINKYINKYGFENTILFIGRVIENPLLKSELKGKQSYYDLYMN